MANSMNGQAADRGVAFEPWRLRPAAHRLSRAGSGRYVTAPPSPPLLDTCAHLPPCTRAGAVVALLLSIAPLLEARRGPAIDSRVLGLSSAIDSLVCGVAAALLRVGPRTAVAAALLQPQKLERTASHRARGGPLLGRGGGGAGAAGGGGERCVGGRAPTLLTTKPVPSSSTRQRQKCRWQPSSARLGC